MISSVSTGLTITFFTPSDHRITYNTYRIIVLYAILIQKDYHQLEIPPLNTNTEKKSDNLYLRLLFLGLSFKWQNSNNNSSTQPLFLKIYLSILDIVFYIYFFIVGFLVSFNLNLWISNVSITLVLQAGNLAVCGPSTAGRRSF